MFNFTTQTIFNTLKITQESDVRSKTAPKGYNVVKGNSKTPKLRIGNIRFEKDNIIDVLEKKYSPESLTKVEFDLKQAFDIVEAASATATKVGDYRIILYLGLSMNSQDSFYANDFTYKGKPLFLEFPVKAGDTVDTVAKRIVKIADKYLLFQAQEKFLDVTCTATAAVEADAGNNIEAADAVGKVTFTGINGYQLITKAILQKYNPEAAQIDCCNAEGAFEDVVIGVPVIYTINKSTGLIEAVEDNDKAQVLDGEGQRDIADNETAITPGLEAFGDYNWIIHNLRLPTLANTYYWSATKSEMPIVGGNYVQFIVRMAVERDGIAGGVLGQRATTVTTHVFYILDQGLNVANFEDLFKVYLSITPKTDADDALENPYKVS